MTGKQLKDWAAQIPDLAIIEVKRYEWEPVQPDKIRALFICTPTRVMEDVCNLEESEATG